VVVKTSRSDQAADLRRRAEKKSRTDEDHTLDILTPEEARQVLHELRVHQIELEMQNEELRQAQEALEASRAQYFDLFDLAPVGYVPLSEKGLIMRANLTAANLLGVTRITLIKQPLSHFILPEDQDIYYRLRKQLLETGMPQACEVRMLRADAAPFWARLEATAALGSDGILGCRVAISDITEFKRVEESLRQSEKNFNVERKYRAILDQTFEFIGMMTLDGTLVEVNRSATNFAGIEESEVLGKPFWETPWWAHSKEMQERLRNAVRAAALGNFVRFEAIHPSGYDGSLHHFDFSIKPVKDENDKVVFLVPEGRDITELKRAEEGLREFEHRFRDLIDNSVAGILFVDMDALTIFSCNQAMAAMLGWSREEINGIPLLEIHPPEVYDRVAREFNEHRNGERQISSNVPVMCKDGSRIFVDITSTTVMLNGVRYLSGFFRDVTERKLAEEQLKRYTEELEAANKALEESKQLADRANRAKSDFLASMSHELRTPLNAVIGFSDGLLERADIHPLNEHQKDRLEKIKANGEYLLQLIDGILDIAKVESGKIDLQISTFDVEPVVWEVGDLADALTKNKPAVRFAIDLEEHLPPITSDRDKVRQILINLLGNAVKFTEKGTVTLRIQSGNGSLIFSMEDTGVGISAEHLGRLFEQFYQVKQETSRSLKGTGLGLAISKAFADLLGGKLAVKSIQGQGSVFTLTVPLTRDCRGRKESHALPSIG
jgi:two-component system, sensor histidine kinase